MIVIFFALHLFAASYLVCDMCGEERYNRSLIILPKKVVLLLVLDSALAREFSVEIIVTFLEALVMAVYSSSRQRSASASSVRAIIT